MPDPYTGSQVYRNMTNVFCLFRLVCYARSIYKRIATLFRIVLSSHT